MDADFQDSIKSKKIRPFSAKVFIPLDKNNSYNFINNGKPEKARYFEYQLQTFLNQ
jgi:hypothetical protein